LFSVWLVWLLIPVAVCDSLISIPRKLRVEFPGVVYHIMSWGWTGAAVLGDNADGQSDRRMVESGEFEEREYAFVHLDVKRNTRARKGEYS